MAARRSPWGLTVALDAEGHHPLYDEAVRRMLKIVSDRARFRTMGVSQGVVRRIGPLALDALRGASIRSWLR